MCASEYLNLSTWKAPKGLHSLIKLNVNIVKDVIASMAVVGGLQCYELIMWFVSFQNKSPELSVVGTR